MHLSNIPRIPRGVSVEIIKQKNKYYKDILIKTEQIQVTSVTINDGNGLSTKI